MTHEELVNTLYAMAREWKGVCASNNCPRLNEITRRARHPQVGDVVFETTHPNRYIDIDTKESAIGELLKVEPDPEGGEVYLIRDLSGQERRWTNASFVALCRAGVPLSRFLPGAE